MTARYEFTGRQARMVLKRSLVRVFVACFLVLYPLYALVVDSGASPRSAFNMAGALLTGITIYTNLSQSHFDLEEVFVPPFRVTSGVEFLILGTVCFVIALFE